MIVKTKHFGEIDLDEAKIITFEQGIMGFEDYKNYTILYDTEDGEKASISWLQSLDEQALAIPVINPLLVKPDYNPVVEDELLKPLGEINEENVVLLLTITVPADLTKMSVNLKAPFVINADTRKGSQIIVENQEYEVKYNIYSMLQKLKEEKGEN
jgi:flagellar assembly factor FliW